MNDQLPLIYLKFENDSVDSNVVAVHAEFADDVVQYNVEDLINGMSLVVQQYVNEIIYMYIQVQ